MTTFVEMRRMLTSNAALFHRLDKIELKKFEDIFKALESDKLYCEKGIFYNGQIFDAYNFVSDIIRSAKSSIILLDNYMDDTVLTLLGKRNNDVTATIYTKYQQSVKIGFTTTTANILQLKSRFSPIVTIDF